MNADSNNIAIVITGPDTRDVSTRTFELREHECCAAHFKDHFIFAMPRDYGLPKGGDNRPSMKFEEYDLWGKGPTRCGSRSLSISANSTGTQRVSAAR